jgi:hypothetical protein
LFNSTCLILPVKRITMPDHDQAMLAYAHLARVSQDKQQLAGRDRFLVLAAAAACRAGWPLAAACFRQKLLEHNPRHQIGRHATAADALRDREFQALLRQLERRHPYEQAEHLVRTLGIDLAEVSDAGQRAMLILGCEPPPRDEDEGGDAA